MKNYSKASTPCSSGEAIGNRIELHDQMNLTGAEISINYMKAGESVPFVHAHKQNEEIYSVLSGKGKAVVDGDEISLEAGDWLRIAPEGKRQLFADCGSDFTYICIQVKANSLEGFTAGDGIVY